MSSPLPNVAAAPDFAAAARMVLDYLRESLPMDFWSVTRVENGRQTYLYDGSLFGAICGIDPEPRTADAPLVSAGPVLQLLGQLLTMALIADRARTWSQLSIEAERLTAETDVLTGLANRRAWERLLEEQSMLFNRFGDPTVLAVLDLDMLKVVNDTHGHATGDDYIRRAAQALRAAVRPSDEVARLGGDEFGILFRHCTHVEAERLVDRIYAQLEVEKVAGSIGWAPITVLRGLPAAMQDADAAMYEAKRERSRRRAHLVP